MNMKSPGPQRQEIDWLTADTRSALLLAQQEAARTGIAFIQPEHLLLGVIIQGGSKAAKAINNSGLDAATLRAHTQAAYGSNVAPEVANPPLSQQAEAVIEYAIAMIAYYLMRTPDAAKVAPEHLVLSVISHPDTQKLLVAFPAKVASLRQQLEKDMEHDFLRHVEDISLLPDYMRDTAGRKTINIAARNREHAKKILAAGNVRCPSCWQQIHTRWKHCTYCGTKLTMRCVKCGTPSPNLRGAKFCIECGGQLS